MHKGRISSISEGDNTKLNIARRERLESTSSEASDTKVKSPASYRSCHSLLDPSDDELTDLSTQFGDLTLQFLEQGIKTELEQTNMDQEGEQGPPLDYAHNMQAGEALAGQAGAMPQPQMQYVPVIQGLPQNVAMNTKGHNLISTFTGGEKATQGVGDWLEQIDNFANMFQWPENLKIAIARSKCRGEAAQFLKCEEEVRNAGTWEEFANAMRERFTLHIPFSTKVKMLFDIKQDRGESVANYASRLRALGAELYDETITHEFRPVVNHFVHAAFLRGLSKDISRFVFSKNTRNLEEAILVAKQEETNDKMARGLLSNIAAIEDLEDDRLSCIEGKMDQLVAIVKDSHQGKKKEKKTGGSIKNEQINTRVMDWANPIPAKVKDEPATGSAEQKYTPQQRDTYALYPQQQRGPNPFYQQKPGWNNNPNRPQGMNPPRPNQFRPQMPGFNPARPQLRPGFRPPGAPQQQQRPPWMNQRPPFQGQQARPMRPQWPQQTQAAPANTPPNNRNESIPPGLYTSQYIGGDPNFRITHFQQGFGGEAPFICYYCYKIGHYARDCRTKQRDQAQALNWDSPPLAQ